MTRTHLHQALLLLAATAGAAPVAAQTQPVDPAAAREGTAAGAVDLTQLDPNEPAKPLASGRERVLSRNEVENRTRAAQGRLGVRLGNDMSFRLGDK